MFCEYLKKSEELLKILEVIDLRFSKFQNENGLSCLSGCGACCLKKDVEASPFEMIPLSLHLIETKSEPALQTLIDSLQKNREGPCYFYERHRKDGQKGKCTIYPYRPLLCRTFGAAGFMNKREESELSLCKLIRESVVVKSKYENIPMMKSAMYEVRGLCSDESLMAMRPVNDAIVIALSKMIFQKELELLAATRES